MTDNYIIAGEQRQAELEVAKAAFFMRGGQVKQGPAIPEHPTPAPRSTRVDPETVLQRRRNKPSFTSHEARRLLNEQHCLRRMADSL